MLFFLHLCINVFYFQFLYLLFFKGLGLGLVSFSYSDQGGGGGFFEILWKKIVLNCLPMIKASSHYMK